MKKQVSNDVENFYKMINEINVYTEVAKENVGEVIDNNVSERSFTEQFAKVQKYYTSNRKPFKFFIELTYNCNLRCKHCYRGEDVRDLSWNKIFLKKERIFSLLDEIEDVGGIEIIFTGGEPFLHPDIFEILEYASDKNLIVTILSNGNFLTDINVVKRLKKYEIFDIRISLYGLQDSHDAMTTVNGSFEKSMQALKNIHEVLGIGTGAIVVTRENYAECEELMSQLIKQGINIAVNSSITPTAKGNKNPLELRISNNQYKNLVEKFKLPLSGTTCTAGISRFRINPIGEVTPCELIPKYSLGNIYTYNLKEILDGKERTDFIGMYENLLKNHVCNKCEYRRECNFCPALFLQENGSFDLPSAYLCQITERKHEILKKRGMI